MPEEKPIIEPKIDEKPKAKSTNPTVAADIAMLTARNQELEAQHQIDVDTIKEEKTKLEHANAGIDAIIRTTLYPQITSMMNIAKVKLDEMSAGELHELHQTLKAIKGDMTQRGRPNVIGADTITRATVDHMPDLYGKSRGEILKEVGAF